MVGTWNSCWTALCPSPGPRASSWPATLPVAYTTCTPRASSTATSPPRTAWCAARPMATQLWWVTSAWRRRSPPTVRAARRSRWPSWAPRTGWHPRYCVGRSTMRRSMCLHTASSCARPSLVCQLTPTTCPALRILVWMSPLSALWWESTAQRPSSSWLFTAAMEPTSRPSFLEITQCLESILQHQLGTECAGATFFGIGESLPTPETSATLAVARMSASCTKQSPLRELGTQHLQPDQRLSRSQSDVFAPKPPDQLQPLEPNSGARSKEMSPRVNPFSQREDLKGGKIKLFDTLSKSVISLTLDLPPPAPLELSTTVTPEPAVEVEVQCDFSAPTTSPRKCHSLPASPELPHQGGLALDVVSPHPTDNPQPPALLSPPAWGQASSPSSRAKMQRACGLDNSELPQPTLLPPNSNFIHTASLGTEPWQPETQSPSRLLINNNHVMVSKPLAWGSGLEHGSSKLSITCGVALEQTEHSAMLPGHSSGAVPEQDEVLPCPGCCVSPFSFNFASICHQPAPSPPRYQNLNSETKSLLCHDRGQHQKAPAPVLAEPRLKLPEAQS
ncbi:dual specificity testis-specific protein kinase 1 isoform X2 [Manacus candei]|uniref:dual specificity testis-specific protein kinase 1 isoform X2 n=1 Tax=Manacus candei TaxID=415023 RepID=UPI002227E470|nr:dual specificity testis-specific protein kinase 1 isoform X2 [Manacus candei]